MERSHKVLFKFLFTIFYMYFSHMGVLYNRKSDHIRGFITIKKTYHIIILKVRW